MNPRIILGTFIVGAYLLSIMTTFAVSKTLGAATQDLRLQAAMLEPMTIAPPTPSRHAQRSQAQQLASVQRELRAICRTTLRGDQTSALLMLSGKILHASAPGVTTTQFDLGTGPPATPTPTQTTPAGAPSSPVSTSSPSPSPTVSPAVVTPNTTRAVTSNIQLAMTLDGPYPAVMQTLDNLAHSEPTITFRPSRLSRNTTNPYNVDLDLTIALDQLPATACGARI